MGRRVIEYLERERGSVSHVAIVEAPIWSSESTVIEPDLEVSSSSQHDKGWIVTVYNNNHNTYMEVITILMVATSCDAEEASIETWEIDHLGQSVVHRDSQENCLEAAKIISTIGIRVEATPDPIL